MRARFKTLPDAVRGTLVAVESADIIREIGIRHNLSEEQQKKLGGDVGLMLLALIPPTVFISNLASHLGLPQQEAQSIAREINIKIFNPAQQSLKKLHTVSVWDIGMGPEPEPYTEVPSSVWSSMEKRRGWNIAVHLLDIMVRLRENA